MKAIYNNLACNKATLLLVMLLTFTFGKAQDLIPYQIDAIFERKVNTLFKDGKFRTYSDVLEERIYETANYMTKNINM